jgi:hypothetical protein
VESCCEHGNEPSGSIKLYDILQWLSYISFHLNIFTAKCVISCSFVVYLKTQSGIT